MLSVILFRVVQHIVLCVTSCKSKTGASDLLFGSFNVVYTLLVGVFCVASFFTCDTYFPFVNGRCPF